MILVDTGPLVAAANRKDAHHTASVAALAAARPPRLVPGLVIAEVSYLLARDASSRVEAEFLRSFATGFLALADIIVADLDRSAELVEQRPQSCRLRTCTDGRNQTVGRRMEDHPARSTDPAAPTASAPASTEAVNPSTVTRTCRPPGKCATSVLLKGVVHRFPDRKGQPTGHTPSRTKRTFAERQYCSRCWGTPNEVREFRRVPAPSGDRR